MSSPSSIDSLGARARAWRSRFHFRPLFVRRFWPFWTGVAIAVVALQMPWTTLFSIGYSESCGTYLSRCPYGQDYGSIWHNPTSGGYGAGDVFLPALGLIAVAIGWAAYRRELPRPTWFARLPTLALAGLALLVLLKLPGAIPPLESFVYDPNRPYYDFSEPGWGVFVFAVALLPLWRGTRRVRRAFDPDAASIEAAAPSPVPSPG